MYYNTDLSGNQELIVNYFLYTNSPKYIVKKRKYFKKKVLTYIKRCDIIYKSQRSGCGAAGSALPWGGRGRKFKSCHSDHIECS